MKKHNLAFVDVETTGFDPIKNEIIELGAIIVKQIPAGNTVTLEVIHELEYKIKPRRLETANPQALRINGYNEADWLFASELDQVLKDFSEKASGATFVAHNLTFDFRFMENAFLESGVANKLHYGKLDTISIAFARLHENEKAQAFSLGALASLLEIKNEKAHTALADARTTFLVYKKLLNLN